MNLFINLPFRNKLMFGLWISLFAMALISLFSVNGCEGEATPSIIQQEIDRSNENQSRLFNVQPPVQLKWSLEREQINKRTELWNDENKVSYLYLLTEYGGAIGYYAIKGKVSSVNSQVTTPEQAIFQAGYHEYAAATIPSPSEDGSYGTNGGGVFAFTTSGV